MNVYVINIQKNSDVTRYSDNSCILPQYLIHEKSFSQEEFETIIYTILKDYKLLIALSCLEFIDNTDDFLVNYDGLVKRFEESKHLKTVNNIFNRYFLVILDILKTKYLFEELSECEKIDFTYIFDTKLF